MLAKKLFQFHQNLIVDQTKKNCHHHSLKWWIHQDGFRIGFFQLTWKEMVSAEITSMANLVLPSLSGLNAATKWCKPNKGTKRAENRNNFLYFWWRRKMVLERRWQYRGSYFQFLKHDSFVMTHFLSTRTFQNFWWHTPNDKIF